MATNRLAIPLPKITMRYEGAGWLRRQWPCYKSVKELEMSDFGELVADILGWLFYGIYHAQINWSRYAPEFADPMCIEVPIDAGGGYATTDYNELFRLVHIASLTGIRIAIAPCTPRMFKLIFHRRAHASTTLPWEHTKHDRMYYAHPTLDEAAQEELKYIKITYPNGEVLDVKP